MCVGGFVRTRFINGFASRTRLSTHHRPGCLEKDGHQRTRSDAGTTLISIVDGAISYFCGRPAFSARALVPVKRAAHLQPNCVSPAKGEASPQPLNGTAAVVLFRGREFG